MSIVRVFPFSRDFVTFPRLLFWRLPSARRRSLPLFLTPLPRHTSPLFLPPAFPSSLALVCCTVGFGEGGGPGGGISRLLGFLFFRGGGGLFGRWRPLLRGKCWNSKHIVIENKVFLSCDKTLAGWSGFRWCFWMLALLPRCQLASPTKCYLWLDVGSVV